MTRTAWVLVFVLALTSVARAQPSSIQVSAAAQVFTADQYRLGSMNRIEPDVGISWIRRQTLQGSLGVDLNVTRRDDSLRLGRALLSLKAAKVGGFMWDLSAGDTGTAPFVPDFGFSNLHAPTLTFAGASVAGANGRVAFRAAGGRTTQTRNLFGTDFIDLRQTMFQADVSVRVANRLELASHGSRVRNGDLGPYSTFVDWAEDIGGGFRFRPTATWQVVADGGISRYRRRGADSDETSPSWLVGTTLAGQKGRFEVNAQRFSVGRFAALNYPYNDRQGIFTSGELQLGTPVRLFGGADIARTNLDPSAAQQASVSMPRGTQTRGFGGVRFQITPRSSLMFRAEGGGREINASQFTPGFESDTGALTAEWHASLPKTSVVARYERRTNVDANYAPSSFRQHEVSGQVFFHLSNGRELFAQGLMMRRADRVGGGETDWYAGGGFQLPILPLTVRFEGTVGRTDDWETGRRADRQLIVAGVSGQIARRTFLTADVVVTHAPISVPGSRPWDTRSMIRVSWSLPYGSALVPSGEGLLPSGGPSGSLDSEVFVDWNGNGERDTDEESATSVAVVIMGLGASRTGRDGRVSFSRVPVGDRRIGLDLTTVHADYDLPTDASRVVEVSRGKRAHVQFGLIPVGSVTGTVFSDQDGDGKLSDADQPVHGAVLTIDDGSRSELAREGQFRFDNIRLGSHTVVIEMDSLEGDAQLVGPPQLDVELTRETRTTAVVFLVRIEKRPEIRKVFPARKISGPTLPASPAQKEGAPRPR